MAPITHIVHFGYSPDISNTEKHLIASKFLLLQDTCLLPTTGPATDRAGKPYIQAISGGKNNSPEPHNQGLEVSKLQTGSPWTESETGWLIITV